MGVIRMQEEMITLLKSKLHHARITKTDKNYVGSIFVCKDLLQKAGIHPYERVEIYNVTNGNRWSTYAVPSDAEGEVSVNGAGARLCQVGDVIIIVSYVMTTNINRRPTIVVLDERNRPITV